MMETKTNIEMIASNLTAIEFDGFCKGMLISRIARGLDKSFKSINAVKQVDFWGKSFERYKHNCKD
jgi:hypothetical protein